MALVRQPHLPVGVLVSGDRSFVEHDRARSNSSAYEPLAARDGLWLRRRLESIAGPRLPGRALLPRDAPHRSALCKPRTGCWGTVCGTTRREPLGAFAAPGRD